MYQYTIDILAADGAGLCRVAVEPDWRPALEWAAFAGIRRGTLPPLLPAAGGHIEPIWSAVGRPYVAGFRVALPASSNSVHAADLTTAYLQPYAEAEAARLVATGRLTIGDTFRYLIRAVPADAAPAAAFAVDDVVEPLPLLDGTLERWLDCSTACGPPRADEMPVFIAPDVLHEAIAAARGAGDLETGGFLVGTLQRDADRPEVFAVVTAQIEARHTRPGATQLTFTADTWTAARADIALRPHGELMIGWWHSHPALCAMNGCPMPRRAACTAGAAPFSSVDVHLHRACFGAVFQLALLAQVSARGELSWSLFGWDRGVVAQRGWHLLQEDGAARGMLAEQPVMPPVAVQEDR